jgi:hypothetical protein
MAFMFVIRALTTALTDAAAECGHEKEAHVAVCGLGKMISMRQVTVGLESEPETSWHRQ